MWQELPSTTTRPSNRSNAITAVDTIGLRGNPKGGGGNFVWGIVRVETDSGHVGLGEAFRGTETLDVVERIAPTIIGANPLDPNFIAEALERKHYIADGGIGRSAIAAIEMACWDVKGKAHDVPVYELFGGKFRDRVPAYSDCESLAGDDVGIDHEEEYTPDAYAEAAREAISWGFETIKFDLDVPTPGRPPEDRAARRLDRAGIEHKVALVAAVREEIGPDVTLGMDCHWSYTVETAVRLGRALEPFDLAFLEDPVHPDKLEAQARVKTAIPIPVLTGENLTSMQAFKDALAADIMDIAAPDISMCAGLAELRRIAAICDLYGVPLAPHNLGSPVATVAAAHVGASIPNCLSIEFRGGDAQWWESVVRRTDGGDTVLVDGAIPVPEGPGLGIELADDAAEYVLDGYESPV